MARFFITGISSGIGYGLTKKLIGKKHQVWGVARREALLVDLAHELNSDRFHYSVCDVTNFKSVKATYHSLKKKEYFPDCVVLNAGINIRDELEGFSLKPLKKVMSTNFYGAMCWIDFFLPRMLEKKHGHFIAISSTSAIQPHPYRLGYCTSKAALNMAFEVLGHRFQSIAFSILKFGPVKTSMGKHHRSAMSVSQAVQMILKTIGNYDLNHLIS